MQSYLTIEEPSKFLWQDKLKFKSPLTQSAYKPHINAFICKMGVGHDFHQNDIEHYFGYIQTQDGLRPREKCESSGTKCIRKAALKFYLNDFLRLRIDFKMFSTKSER